jgi:hypothetical protein
VAHELAGEVAPLDAPLACQDGAQAVDDLLGQLVVVEGVAGLDVVPLVGRGLELRDLLLGPPPVGLGPLLLSALDEESVAELAARDDRVGVALDCAVEELEALLVAAPQPGAADPVRRDGVIGVGLKRRLEDGQRRALVLEADVSSASSTRSSAPAGAEERSSS